MCSTPNLPPAILFAGLADEVRAAAAAAARLPDEQRGYGAAGAAPLGVQGPADRGSQVSPDA